jgi:hypothetical protein
MNARVEVGDLETCQNMNPSIEQWRVESLVPFEPSSNARVDVGDLETCQLERNQI